MKKLFGTDGVRGEAGKFPLNPETIKIVGMSLAKQLEKKLGKKPRFIIGRDTRESGEWIEQAFHDGAQIQNAECESAKIMTTPGVAFLTRKYGFDAGVVISASHNPFEDNGIKIFSPTGKKIDSQTERQIEKDIFEYAGGETNSGKISKIDSTKARQYQKSYLEYLSEEFPKLNLSNLKMVVDCANGAAFELAPKLFKNFSAEVFAINNQPDGRNINLNCGSLHLENLQKAVIEKKANFGVAFDGDADRALFIDEKGNLVDGDATLWILAQFLHEHGKLNDQKVVATVMSNIGLEIALRKEEIKLERTAVGDKYVLEKLLETNSSLGGEQSGHIILPKKSLVGDGLMTTLFVLEAMFEKKKSLSEMTEGFTRFPQVLVNVKVREKIPFEDVTEIASAAKTLDEKLKENGRLLLRYSGTENLARVMIEGKNQSGIEFQANELAEIIRKNLG